MTPRIRPIGLRVTGKAPPDVVWERYAVPARWPSWSPQIRRVVADTERIATGTRGTVHGPPGVRVAFEVEDVDESARSWRWRVHPVLGGLRVPLDLVLDHAVLAAAGGGSTTTLTIRTEPVIALPVALGYAPLARLALHRLVRAQL
jgi:hypothetical protein